jgi:predicted dehydrogenase
MAHAKSVRWAVVGPGRIAHKFAKALRHLPEAHLAAVISRDLQRAQAFAATWGNGDTVCAEELSGAFDQTTIHAVYVATPHSAHADGVRQALKAGKAVLCEKPLTPNAVTTAELIALAKRHQTFLMEAVWTRFLPIYATVKRWLEEGSIGTVRSMQSRFCLDVPFSPTHRSHDPAQAGGALLDIGIYNITVTRMLLESAAVTSFDVHALPGPLGCDVHLAAKLYLQGGATSQFVCRFDGVADNSFHVSGEQGHITVESGFWQATAATIHIPGEPMLRVHAPFACNGFEYQIEEVHRCIAQTQLESASMPLRESLAVVELMDAMRQRIGLRYPFE